MGKISTDCVNFLNSTEAQCGFGHIGAFAIPRSLLKSMISCSTNWTLSGPSSRKLTYFIKEITYEADQDSDCRFHLLRLSAQFGQCQAGLYQERGEGLHVLPSGWKIQGTQSGRPILQRSQSFVGRVQASKQLKRSGASAATFRQFGRDGCAEGTLDCKGLARSKAPRAYP